MYGLRKITKDGKNEYNDFTWPLQVGAVVEAPDWNPNAECGGGLHCLPNAQGDYRLLTGCYWAVIEFKKKDMVMIDTEKCKVKKCKIVYLSENPDGLLQYFDIDKFDSRSAYYWARSIGNKDVMIDRITDSENAYWWALHIGNRDVMIDRVTESKWAYKWALYIGNQDIMIDRVTESEWAYYWARYIGTSRDIMIDRVTESMDAYKWAVDIGDKDVMINKITDSYWAYLWARYIGTSRDIMIARFPELQGNV